MKQPSERGVTGAWAYQARQEAALSVEQVADELARRGQAVTPATIRGIESGSKKPGARLLRVLAQVLDSTPPGADPAGEPSLAAALSALAEELAASREERAALRLERETLSVQVEALERAVQVMASQLADLAARASAAPRAPRESAGSGR